MSKEQAAMRKAEWLLYCLEIGWQKKHLDDLSAIWDKYKDEYGGFKPLPISEPTEDTLRVQQSRERLRYKEALEKIVSFCDKHRLNETGHGLIKSIADEALKDV